MSHEYAREHPSCICTSGLGMKRNCPEHGRLVRSTERADRAPQQILSADAGEEQIAEIARKARIEFMEAGKVYLALKDRLPFEAETFVETAFKRAIRAALAAAKHPANTAESAQELARKINIAAEGFRWKYDYKGNSEAQAALNDILDFARANATLPHSASTKALEEIAREVADNEIGYARIVKHDELEAIILAALKQAASAQPTGGKQ